MLHNGRNPTNHPRNSEKQSLFYDCHFPSYILTLLLSSPFFPFSKFSFSRSPPSSAGNMANASSGMAVNDECKIKFLDLKAKRSYRYIVFKIEDGIHQVVVEKLGEPQCTFEDFTNSLPANECRYAVFDFDFTTIENVPKSKIFFVAWSPAASKVRSKMLYASSKDRFRRELNGVQVELQATDASEITLDIVKSRAF